MPIYVGKHMNDNDVLRLALAEGIIDLDAIKNQVEVMERQKYLDQHTGKIWQDSSGRWTTYIKGEKGRKLIKKTQKKDLEDYLINYYCQLQERHYLYDTCLEWIEQKKEYGEIEPQSADRYKRDATKYFLKSSMAKVDMADINEYDLEDFIKKTIHSEELTQKAWSNFRIILNGTFKYAKKRGYTSINIRTFMDELELSRKSFKKKIKEDTEEVFTDTEVKRIEKYIYNNRLDAYNLGIVLAFHTGLRVGELSALKVSDLQGHVLSVTRTEVKAKDENGKDQYSVREFTKGRDGHRQVIITDHAVKIFNEIAAYNPNGVYLFERNGSRVKSQVFTNRLYRMCDTLGITKRSMHKCRKTYATRLFNNGLSEKLIQKQMGHTSILTTQSYYHFNNYEIDKATEAVQRAMGGY